MKEKQKEEHPDVLELLRNNRLGCAHPHVEGALSKEETAEVQARFGVLVMSHFPLVNCSSCHELVLTKASC